MRKSDHARSINMGLDVDRLADAFRAADSISASLRALDNPWLKQSLLALDERQVTMASALKLSNDMPRPGRLLTDSPIIQYFQRTSGLMAGWERRFRLPEIGEMGSLLASVQKSPWSAFAVPQTSYLADALAKM